MMYCFRYKICSDLKCSNFCIPSGKPSSTISLFVTRIVYAVNKYMFISILICKCVYIFLCGSVSVYVQISNTLCIQNSLYKIKTIHREVPLRTIIIIYRILQIC